MFREFVPIRAVHCMVKGMQKSMVSFFEKADRAAEALTNGQLKIRR